MLDTIPEADPLQPSSPVSFAANIGRQLLQIAGVSAGAISTLGSGPEASLGQLGAAGSDYRSSWAAQANQQSASGASSMGKKSESRQSVYSCID